MSLTYSTFVTSYANMLAVTTTDPRFVQYLPNTIDYSEQRIYRDLQLLGTKINDSSSALIAGTRTFSLPSSNGTFIVVDTVNVVTPAGQVSPGLGTRVPLLPASKEVLDTLWPSSTGSSVPQYFNRNTDATIIVGPFPDAAYQVEVYGTVRPQALSSTNTTTILSVYFPDLFLTAACVFGAGALKNFGAMTDDPKSGQSWEAQYGALLQSAATENAMKMFTAQGWSAKPPAALATPPRT